MTTFSSFDMGDCVFLSVTKFARLITFQNLGINSLEVGFSNPFIGPSQPILNKALYKLIEPNVIGGRGRLHKA
jgi:hypothetical protein